MGCLFFRLSHFEVGQRFRNSRRRRQNWWERKYFFMVSSIFWKLSFVLSLNRSVFRNSKTAPEGLVFFVSSYIFLSISTDLWCVSLLTGVEREGVDGDDDDSLLKFQVLCCGSYSGVAWFSPDRMKDIDQIQIQNLDFCQVITNKVDYIN